MIEIPLGQAIRLTASFLNAAGAAADPTTVTFKYAPVIVNPPPDPTATSDVFGVGSTVKDSTGNYHLDFTPNAAGNWVYQAIGTGTVAAVATGHFRVIPSPFA
jgi:hypothetical protein